MDSSTHIQEYLATTDEVISYPENYTTFLNEWVGLENVEGVRRAEVSHDGLTSDILTNIVLQDLFDHAESVVDDAGRHALVIRRLDKWNALVNRYELSEHEFLGDRSSETLEDDFSEHFGEDPGVLSEIAERILSRDAPGFVGDRREKLEALIELHFDE